MNLNSGLIATVFVLTLLLLVPGCVSPAPANPAPVTPAQSSTMATPVVTQAVYAAGTTLPVNPIPEETPVPMQAYVKRPFGLVQYEYNPAHKVKLLDSHVETDSTGAKMVVGTIKNIGTERIDLVTVTINLFDADGNVIGSASSEVNYLEPNKVWKFRAVPSTMTDFRSHQIAEIFTG
jgi:hypothetical protein